MRTFHESPVFTVLHLTALLVAFQKLLWNSEITGKFCYITFTTRSMKETNILALVLSD